MRVRTRHGDDQALNYGIFGEETKRQLPCLRISIQFFLQDGSVGQEHEVWGMVDTGADLISLPTPRLGTLEELDRSRYAKTYMSPRIVTLEGFHKEARVPAYRALVRVNQEIIDGPCCAACGEWKWRGDHSQCKPAYPRDVFNIASVPTLPYAIIGREVLRHFLTVVDPWRRETSFVNEAQGTGLQTQIAAAFLGSDINP